MEASRMMDRPMMNATTGLALWAGTGSCKIGLDGEEVAEDSVDVDVKLVDIEEVEAIHKMAVKVKMRS
jgi:hypothetical protein